jgi:thymidylate synthase ThyX
MIKIEGKGGISATIIADSISPAGDRMTTFEWIFPRFILSEINTHRMLSKNAASSRAVPASSQESLILVNPAMPIHWGENEPGMKASKHLDPMKTVAAIGLWKAALQSAVSIASVAASKLGVNGHKQWVNRITENYTFTKQVISGTEWTNLWWLRDHPDAQPEFKELAKCAKQAYDISQPVLLKPGQWHLPYIETRVEDTSYWLNDTTVLPLETARMVSASCCAQVSYRKLDDTVEKAQKIFDMLNLGSTENPSHSSPTEHQATPMQPRGMLNIPKEPGSWEIGVTHLRRDMSLWSGNLRGWIQYRQLIPNEAKW